MKLIQAISLLLLISIFGGKLQAQEKNEVKNYSFQKGEVLDIIFLSYKSNTDSLWNVYLNGPMPLAKKLGHKSRKALQIMDSPMQGNYHPTFMILGTWQNLEERNSAMVKIEDKIEGFHQLRRAIWSNFDMTYYELDKSWSFEVNRDDYYVVTAYWNNGKGNFKKYIEGFGKEVKQSHGELLLELEEGKSPFGYHFQPDYLSITSWKNKAAFELFYDKNLKMDHSSIQHVNQFSIQ